MADRFKYAEIRQKIIDLEFMDYGLLINLA